MARVLRLGRRGRWFESSRPDKNNPPPDSSVGLEHLPSKERVAGSNPAQGTRVVNNILRVRSF